MKATTGSLINPQSKLAKAVCERPIAVAVGIVAWNEEENIEAALDSLLKQTLFADLADADKVCQVVLICNGSVDNTPLIAQSFFEDAAQNHRYRSAFDYKILAIEQAGKLNAINYLLSTAAPSEADFLIVMDADITIQSRSSLTNMCAALQGDPEAWFAVPTSIRRSQAKGRTMRTNLSIQGGALHLIGTADKPNWVTGQLYCVRSRIAQAVYLPKELLVDDMFLSILAHSNFFTRSLNAPDKSRVVRVESATYCFEPYLRLRDVLASQKRQAMAHVLQHVLIRWIDANLAESQKGITALSATLKAKDASGLPWLKQLLIQELRDERKPFWQLLPNMYYTWPLRAVWEGVQRGSLLLLPIAITRSFLHFLGLYRAARAFHDGQTYFWTDRHSSSD